MPTLPTPTNTALSAWPAFALCFDIIFLHNVEHHLPATLWRPCIHLLILHLHQPPLLPWPCLDEGHQSSIILVKVVINTETYKQSSQFFLVLSHSVKGKPECNLLDEVKPWVKLGILLIIGHSQAVPPIRNFIIH